MRKKKSFRPTLNEKLEDRTVPSAMGHGGVIALVSNGSGGNSGGGGSLGGGGGLERLISTFGNLLGGGQMCGGSGYGGSSSTALSTASRDVSAAIQNFDTSVVGPAEKALQAAINMGTTATSAQGTFTGTITAAIPALNTTINADLANDLPNTYTTIESSITGATNSVTASLLSNLTTDASGDSTAGNASYLTLNKVVQEDVRTAINAATSAIKADMATGTPISGTTLQTFDQTVRSANSTFNTAVTQAEAAAISANSVSGLSGSTGSLTTAATALQGTITGALPTALTSSTSTTINPTTAISNAVAAFEKAIATITTNPGTTNTSQRLFLRQVSSAVQALQSSINQALQTAIQDYNNSLY